MDFAILGPLEVRDGGVRLCPSGGVRQRVVLAVLLLHANEFVARDWLIDAVWRSGRRPTRRMPSTCRCRGCVRPSAAIASRRTAAATRCAWRTTSSILRRFEDAPRTRGRRRRRGRRGAAPRGARPLARRAPGRPRPTTASRTPKLAHLEEARLAALDAADRRRPGARPASRARPGARGPGRARIHTASDYRETQTMRGALPSAAARRTRSPPTRPPDGRCATTWGWSRATRCEACTRHPATGLRRSHAPAASRAWPRRRGATEPRLEGVRSAAASRSPARPSPSWPLPRGGAVDGTRSHCGRPAGRDGRRRRSRPRPPCRLTGRAAAATPPVTAPAAASPAVGAGDGDTLEVALPLRRVPRWRSSTSRPAGCSAACRCPRESRLAVASPRRRRGVVLAGHRWRPARWRSTLARTASCRRRRSVSSQPASRSAPAGSGSTDANAAAVLRIDPDYPQARTVIRLPSAGATRRDSSGQVAVGHGAVWVAHGAARVTRIDPASGRVVASIDCRSRPPSPPERAPSGPSAASGATWCASIRRPTPRSHGRTWSRTSAAWPSPAATSGR